MQAGATPIVEPVETSETEGQPRGRGGPLGARIPDKLGERPTHDAGERNPDRRACRDVRNPRASRVAAEGARCTDPSTSSVNERPLGARTPRRARGTANARRRRAQPRSSSLSRRPKPKDQPRLRGDARCTDPSTSSGNGQRTAQAGLPRSSSLSRRPKPGAGRCRRAVLGARTPRRARGTRDALGARAPRRTRGTEDTLRARRDGSGTDSAQGPPRVTRSTAAPPADPDPRVRRARLIPTGRSSP